MAIGIRKVTAVLVVVMLVAGVAFGATTFEVKDGKAIITETEVNQPVSYQNREGKSVNIPGTTRDITTKISVTKEQAQMQIIQLNKNRTQTVATFNKNIANIDAQLKLLKDIDAALPEVVAEEPIE